MKPNDQQTTPQIIWPNVRFGLLRTFSTLVSNLCACYWGAKSRIQFFKRAISTHGTDRLNEGFRQQPAGAMAILSCLLIGLLLPDSRARSQEPQDLLPPVWLDAELFDRLMAETPLRKEELDEARRVNAEKSNREGLADAGVESESASPSGAIAEGVIGVGPHHRTIRSLVDRGQVLKARQDRERSLKQRIRDFERQHRGVLNLSSFQQTPENALSEIQRQWLAFQVEGELLTDEIRVLGDSDKPLFEEHTVVSSGEYYWSPRAKQWRASRPEIEVIEGVGIARQGQQKVLFAPNISEEGSIDITTPDGIRLKGTVLGLAFVDEVSGEDQIIATIRSTPGELVGTNQMVYRDAFDGVEADVIYTYRKSGLEQDVVLRSRIPRPEVLGMDSATTRLEVLTEWFDVPEPQIRVQTLDRESGRGDFEDERPAGLVADQSLSFGAVEMALGRAFWRPGERRSNSHKETELNDLPIAGNGLPAGLEHDLPRVQFPVTKQWLKQEGRTILCEGVAYRSIDPLLRQLPETKKERVSLPRKDDTAVAYLGRQLPSLPVSQNAPSDGIKLAYMETLAALRAPGFVLDYYTLNPATDFRFEAGRTYRVRGDVILSGTTVIEGGAVIKFDRSSPSNSVQIRCLGNVVCETGPYQPAVFTAVDDSQFGARLSYNPVSGYYAANALWVEPGGASVTIENVRIKHAINGVFFENSQGGRLRHSQLIGCRHPIATRYQDLRVENVLVDDFGRYAFWASSGDPSVPLLPGQEARIHAEQVTVHNGPWLAYNTHWNGQMNRGQTEYKNSLLVNVNGGTVDGRFFPGDIGGMFTHSYFLPNVSKDSVFTTRAAGGFYLPDGSPYRDVGGTNIDGLLGLELQQRTTTAPNMVSGVVSGTLNPRTLLDNDGDLDLGYHYDRLDYALNSARVRGDVLVAPGTIVGCWGWAGMFLDPYRATDTLSVHLQGAPGNRIICADIGAVQEQTATASKGMRVSNRWRDSSIIAEYADFYGIMSHYVIDAGYWNLVGNLDMRHCRIFNAGMILNVEAGHQMSFFNCLFSAEDYLHFNGQGGLSLAHCLIRESNWVRLNHEASGSDPWLVEHNVFDECRVQVTNPYASSFKAGVNAKIPVSYWWMPGVFIQVPAPFPWQSGPLGKFYQPGSGNPLLDATTRSADSGPVGERLTHHTVRGDLVPEGLSLVDFGLHYMATDADGNFLDHNLDGIPSYLQDSNGNGVVDPGEVDWIRPPGDLDADGLPDDLERLLGSNPRSADTDGDGVSDPIELAVNRDLLPPENWALDQSFRAKILTIHPAHSTRQP